MCSPRHKTSSVIEDNVKETASVPHEDLFSTSESLDVSSLEVLLYLLGLNL